MTQQLQLDWIKSEASNLENCCNDNPLKLLGPHLVENNWVIRVWMPEAEEVSIVFKNKISKAYEEGKLLENKFYERGNSRYVIVEGDTWEAAQANAVSLGGNLATINDKEENDWIVEQLHGDGKASDLLKDKYYMPGEVKWGKTLWLGHVDQNLEGKYTSVSGEKNIYSNWVRDEEADGVRKKEKYTQMYLFESPGYIPGQLGTVYNRQTNTPSLRAEGGRHIFYGLAEIKIDE